MAQARRCAPPLRFARSCRICCPGIWGPTPDSSGFGSARSLIGAAANRRRRRWAGAQGPPLSNRDRWANAVVVAARRMAECFVILCKFGHNPNKRVFGVRACGKSARRAARAFCPAGRGLARPRGPGAASGVFAARWDHEARLTGLNRKMPRAQDGMAIRAKRIGGPSRQRRNTSLPASCPAFSSPCPPLLRAVCFGAIACSQDPQSIAKRGRVEPRPMRRRAWLAEANWRSGASVLGEKEDELN